MLDKEFFRGLNPVSNELFCDKVERVCKEMRQKYPTSANEWMSWTAEREYDLEALCETHGVPLRVPMSILFGDRREQQTRLNLYK